MKKTIVCFASGSGSNVEAITRYFRTKSIVHVARVFCNRHNAPVIKRAEMLGIPVSLFNRSDLYINGVVSKQLIEQRPDLIVLAGFLWLIPRNITDTFPNRIVNIHPALLPRYGGKGMYGLRVHEAVLAAGEKQSGITIHYVNAHYDEGDIIYQESCPVFKADTPESLAQRIQQLEHQCYPKVIEELLSR